MTGKEKCELLKTIRKNIAELNGIEYEPEPCNHDGDCLGFCPRCDMEAQNLMAQLRRKEAAGSPIRIDTESIGDFETLVSNSFDDEEEILMGEPEPLTGIVMCPKDPEEEVMDEVLDENGINDYGVRYKIKNLCSGCFRFSSIRSTEKGIRCDCLSEIYYEKKMNDENPHCQFKKTSENDKSEIENWKDNKNK